MSKIGKKLIKAAKQALVYARPASRPRVLSCTYRPDEPKSRDAGNSLSVAGA